MHVQQGQKWTFDLSPRQRMHSDHTLDLSKALKNQGTDTTSIWILKKRKGSRLTRTCRVRLLNRDNTSSIFHRRTNGWMRGQTVMEINACKQREQSTTRDRDVSHLFQPLHVFEVESNVKKAEIRIYKLKLQGKEKAGVIQKKSTFLKIRFFITWAV